MVALMQAVVLASYHHKTYAQRYDCHCEYKGNSYQHIMLTLYGLVHIVVDGRIKLRHLIHTVHTAILLGIVHSNDAVSVSLLIVPDDGHQFCKLAHHGIFYRAKPYLLFCRQSHIACGIGKIAGSHEREACIAKLVGILLGTLLALWHQLQGIARCLLISA